MSNNIVIIGPSGVGKTALVASVQQAANVTSLALRDRGINISVQPKNTFTRDLFQQVLSLLKDGYLPFQGSAEIIEYEAVLSSILPQKSFFGRLYTWLGWNQEVSGNIAFPDAPGGALFHGDDDEADPVVMKGYRKLLVEKLRSAQGLMVCIDSSVLDRNVQDKNALRNVALEFTRWLPNIFAEVLEHGDATTLSLKRVCFVLTKSDLWAQKHGLAETAEVSVCARNPYEHAKDILGSLFFNSIRNYLPKDVEVAFCMSSVFGFRHGKVHDILVNGEEKKQGEVMDTIFVDDWKPHCTVEPFLFLVQGENLNNNIKVLSWGDLGG